MEGTKFNAKWDRKCYPATIIRQINEKEVKVEFESIGDIEALNVSTNSPSIKSIAGTFNRQLFKIFFKDIMGDSDFVSPLSVQELANLDLKSSLFSAHASERIEERYCENKQEFLRSLKTDQYFAFRETRRRVFSDCVRIDCTPDLKRIHSRQNALSTRAVERPNLELEDIGHLGNAIKAWNVLHPLDAIPLDFESCQLSSDVVTTIQVITTTTRFVLSEDCSHLVTVIKLERSFGEWQKYQTQKKMEKLEETKQKMMKMKKVKTVKPMKKMKKKMMKKKWLIKFEYLSCQRLFGQIC